MWSKDMTYVSPGTSRCKTSSVGTGCVQWEGTPSTKTARSRFNNFRKMGVIPSGSHQAYSYNPLLVFCMMQMQTYFLQFQIWTCEGGSTIKMVQIHTDQKNIFQMWCCHTCHCSGTNPVEKPQKGIPSCIAFDLPIHFIHLPTTTRAFKCVRFPYGNFDITPHVLEVPWYRHKSFWLAELPLGIFSIFIFMALETPLNRVLSRQKASVTWLDIYDPGSRFATTPPPPPHGMVPKPAFGSIPHENVVFAMFFAWWVPGAARKPANSWDFCNQTSENVLCAMFRLRHRGVVQSHPLLFLCQIII